jgi:hypothetical protein
MAGDRVHVEQIVRVVLDTAWAVNHTRRSDTKVEVEGLQAAIAKLEKELDAAKAVGVSLFADRYPVGSRVRFWPGAREGEDGYLGTVIDEPEWTKRFGGSLILRIERDKGGSDYLKWTHLEPAGMAKRAPVIPPAVFCACNHPMYMHDVQDHHGDGTELCCVSECPQNGCPGQRPADATADTARIESIGAGLDRAETVADGPAAS